MKSLSLIFAMSAISANALAEEVSCKFQSFKFNESSAAVFLTDCESASLPSPAIAIAAETGCYRCKIAEDSYDGKNLFKLFTTASPGQVVVIDLERIHAGYGGSGLYAVNIATNGVSIRSYRGDIYSPVAAKQLLLLNDRINHAP